LAPVLAASFFVPAAFFAGAFLAEALAFVVDEVPVTDLFAAPRLDGAVVFLVVVVVVVAFDLGLEVGFDTVFLGTTFFVVVLGFSASAFFEVAFEVVFLVVDDLGLVAALVVFAFDTGLVAVLVVVAVLDRVVDLEVVDLEVGLFSLLATSVDLDLGANLIRPEGPLGRTKRPFSSPVAMALDNWVAWAAPISI